MAKRKQTKPTDTTEYRVYMGHSQEDELVAKLLDLFVHAFMCTELDIPTNQRSNNPPVVEITEEVLKQWLENN